jgi:hypothetical protein
MKVSRSFSFPRNLWDSVAALPRQRRALFSLATAPPVTPQASFEFAADENQLAILTLERNKKCNHWTGFSPNRRSLTTCGKSTIILALLA